MYERTPHTEYRRRTMNANLSPKPALPTETRVLHTNDGEPGTILNGFTYDAETGEWTEYEVVTNHGIERWERKDFILFSEFENND
jgi:hypothetical protein